MTPAEMSQRAMDLFMQRMHCSQAVALAGHQALGLSQPEVIKALGAFGGGIASSGRACGCLTGAVAMLSGLFSRADPTGSESPLMWKLSARMLRRFEELTAQYGSVDCRDIAQCDWRDREAVKAFYGQDDSRRVICRQLVGDTAQALGEILERAKAEGQI